MPIVLVPTDGVPAAGGDLSDADWNALLASQLADVRTAAENWRNGLIAMQGLVAAVLVVKGPSDIDGLDTWAGYIVGVLLVLALALSVWGAWASLLAAYGSPKIVVRSDVEQSGITGLRYAAATAAIANLHRARIAALATIVLLVAALGLTWYGPRTPQAVLLVRTKNGTVTCGVLGSSAHGSFELELPNAAVAAFDLTDVNSIVAVASCGS